MRRVDAATLAPSAELRHLTPVTAGSPIPGLALAGLAAATAFVVSLAVPVSPIVVAVLLGVVLTNLSLIPDRARPGLAVAAKKLLRVGIVLMGFRLALGDLAHLGFTAIGLVAVVVAGTFFGTIWLGRRLGCSGGLSLLVATGFAICGASAIAAAEPFADADQEDVAFSIALVTLCGSLAIPVLSLLGPLLGLHSEHFGFWVGASVHDVAQVVATASSGGAAAVQAAIVVKLARVAMLAPIVAGLSVARRRRVAVAVDGARRPPLLPLFVVGFLVAVGIRSTGVLSAVTLGRLKTAEQILLAAAMVGLGAGVRVSRLRRIGHRPLLLGLLAWLLVATVAFVGTEIVL